tara:strand:- start:12 stop:782 length:771 start_codon:yes stop_codon:yes gene_type:complete
MTNYTLTYSESVQGWPSFYSYNPEFILGMNQYLYSFNGGNLYRHNTNERRNNYYGVDYDSSITGVFNQEPTVTKVFKTIELESDDSWDCSLASDLGEGYMPASYFEQKEGGWFAFIRRISNSQNFDLRSTQGIGSSSETSGTSPGTITISFLISISSIINYGDNVYYKDLSGTGEIRKVGKITSISSDRKTIEANAADLEPPGTGIPTGAYVFTTKNSVAESYGTLGYYLQFKLTNSNTNAVELFAVDADVFKSNP